MALRMFVTFISSFEHTIFQLPRMSNGDCALIVVSEMSTEGSLITSEYTKAATALGRANSHIVAGFVCQERCSDDDRMIFLTPGLFLEMCGHMKVLLLLQASIWRQR